MGPPPFGDGDIIQSGECMTTFAASMGPPPFGDGDSQSTTRGASRSPSFNGATAFRRWRSGAYTLVGSTGTSLQWGHRLSAMEIGRHPERCWRGPRASMGPPPFGDGDHPDRVRIDSDSHASMGPPPFGDGDRGGLCCSGVVSDALQWGHRLSAMEMLPPLCNGCLW